MRWYATGDVDDTKPIGRARTPVEERFWRKVEKSDGCWLFTGKANNGYASGGGHRTIGDGDGRIVYAHRLSWELANGPIPDGMWVLHSCDNPPCVKPDHLFLGTQSDNTKDMWAKGRGRPGRFVGEAHPMAKLTDKDVADIRARYRPRVGVGALAAEYGVHRATISNIGTGKKRSVD